MTTPKPTIILVHGAWHSPEHFQPLEEALRSHGYRTVSPWLPSMHYERLNAPPVSGIDDDVSAIRGAIVSELASSPAVDVVLVSHSYGTVPAGAAIKDLDKSSRAWAGHRNGVTALLIISGLLAPPGISLLDWNGGQVPPTMAISTITSPVDPTREVKVCAPVSEPGPIALFYHDLAESDAQAAQRYASLCTPQVWAVHKTPVPFAPWKPGPKSDPGLDLFYLVCEEDRGLPAAFQRTMIEGTDRDIAAAHQAGSAREDEARKIHVTSINSGHFPFLSRVDETTQWVRRCCGEEEV
ncbi:uncharacterized protein PV07_05352 [Cladophialophora immunda]|uniref:AB hydrolase-1 domain-containing protein n=1 Tax=Cladophialophora immunda TaxID=569365 RepID=A0A0D2CHB9_9EURO|nr:uncharacterized protein PV07_05352 [Cladophialophora immunda]KIW29540.1 hypothetical protein PV07_05352 [Cladophialophora immunda]OQV07534.1 hypothetical protein CLAIMM_11957 [Cladophialophora immunda]